jgi:hypothetical protein
MRTILLTLFVGLSFFTIAQTGDDEWLDLLRKEQIDCDDINANSMRQLPDLLMKEKLDSASLVYRQWDARCPNYYVLTLRTLWAIQYDSVNAVTGLLTDLGFIGWYDEQHNLSYRSNAQKKEFEEGKALSNRYRSYSKNELKYWSYIKLKAERLSKRYDSNSFRYVMARFLAHDVEPLYQMLKEENVSIVPKAMVQNYLTLKEERINIERSEFGLYANLWLPTGNLNQLGAHPGLGFFLGGSKNRFRYIARFNFNFLEAANTYSVLQADTLVETDRFVGYYVGLEVDYIFYSRTHHEWSLGAGVGYSGIEAVENTAFEDEQSNAVVLNSLDLSLGFEYRYYSKKYSYVGVGVRYSANNYNNRIDNAMQGNTVNLRLIFGFASGDGYRYNNLGLR